MTESTTARRVARAQVDEPAFTSLRERTAARLLPAVERLLESASFRELSVEQIVAEAGISRSTFYHYFEDRADLLRALTADVMGTILQATAAWWKLPPDATRAEVTTGLQQVIMAYSPHATLMAAVGESVPHDPLLREAFLSFMSAGMKEMEQYVARGQAAGAVAQSLNARATAHWLTWMFERGLSQLSRTDAAYPPERVLEAIVDLVTRALRP